MADLAKRKRIRAGHRGSATKTINKVNEALGADSVDVSVLLLLKLTLSEKLQKIKARDAEYCCLVSSFGQLVSFQLIIGILQHFSIVLVSYKSLVFLLV